MTDTGRYGPLMLRRGFVAGSAAGLAAMALPRSGRAQGAAVLKFGLSAYPPNMDPFSHSGTAADTVKLQVFRGLLGLDHDGNVVGEVAGKWDQSRQTDFVFHIRPNATFQNGDPVTAADVQWSIEQITKPGSTAYLLSDLKVISKIEAVDAKTVRIVLHEPTPSFSRLLATPYVPVLSAKAGLASPVGAGPYRIARLERGVSVDFEAFEGYYKEGYPKTKKLQMIVYADENLRVTALETGDLDIIEYVPWQDMARIQKNPALVLEESFGAVDMDIVFNVKQPPFGDARVRQAVAYAIKREDIVKAAFFGRGKPLYGLPLNENSIFANAKTEDLWRYDPNKAKSLLKQAGVVGHKVTMLATSTYAMHQDTAEVVQQYLIAAGLQVALQLPDWGARVALGNKGQYQFAINGVAPVISDPDGLTTMIGSGPASYQRSFGYSNKKLDALLARGRHEVDLAKRKLDYEAVAALVKEDVPLCMLTRRSQGYGLKKTVQGFHALPGSDNGYSGYVLEDAFLS